ncbi:MAG TPA: VOC family protein [Acidimicrobiia bacterium]
MPIEHLGIGVPDVEAAKGYYDELMPMLGFRSCFGNGYRPNDWQGAQLFLYETESDVYSRHAPGLDHIAFLVSTRREVHHVHDWVLGRGDRVLVPPTAFPEFGEHYYATYFLDPHGFKIEVVCVSPEVTST